VIAKDEGDSEVIPAMKRAARGNILFIGATASRRGGPRSAAFAPAKAAQRSLAESMARQLWPAGIHVALLIPSPRPSFP
jgi:NAD(P)-dependent dehydrogenase (short-subunit alcohol dehydrogenase family)